MREIILQNKKINSENSTFIIAEIGNNHQGSLELAYNLVDQAVKSGVDAVKFGPKDVMRHKIVSSIVSEYEKRKKNKN